ncbi:MAG: hypothetical protein ACR2L1_03620 [Pyrinomonadaceae bacterium]
MNKTKIKQRFANAADAFFADENSIENNLESFRNETNLWQDEKFSDFAHKHSKLETVLKQIFLFSPGTFILYMLSLVLTIGLINVIFGSSRMILGFQDFVGILAVFLAASLMTWLGLGDVRKPMHLVIPASVIITGVFFGAVAAIASEHFSRSIFINGYPAYFLPLALIVPFLAKGWVDRKSD